jgi:hypothetical protein
MPLPRMNSFSLTLIALTALLAGCAVDRDPSKGRFLTNDRGAVVPTDRLAEIASAWKNDPMAVFGRSGAGKRDASWTVDYIAYIEGQGISPCKELQALRQR